MSKDHDKDKFKKYIDDIFDNLDSGGLGDSAKKPMPFKKRDQEDISDFCSEKAYDELEYVRNKFIDFQDSISKLAIAEYMMPAIEHFATYASSIAQVIEQDYDSEEVASTMKESPASVKKLRANIFSSIYNKYKK